MTASNLMETFRAQIVADKKKFAVLGGLFCVLCVIIGRAVFSGSQPEPARASLRPAQVTAPERITPIPEPRKAKGPESTQGVAPPTPVALTADGSAGRGQNGNPARRKRIASIEGLRPELARDLFTTSNWNQFPLVSAPEAGPASSRKAREFWGNVLQAASENRKLCRDEAAALARELAELHLQSTLTGPSASAYISGRLVHEGDNFAGFSVVQIKERKVVLRKFGQVHELKMQ